MRRVWLLALLAFASSSSRPALAQQSATSPEHLLAVADMVKQK